MKPELRGATMVIVAAVMIFVLRPRQGVPVDFIRRSSGDFQAVIGSVVTSFLFVAVGMIITGALWPDRYRVVTPPAPRLASMTRDWRLRDTHLCTGRYLA